MFPIRFRANERVSVVIPAYRAEAFIKETVASVRDQAYRPIEVVVVEDCSPDRTGVIVEELSELWSDSTFQVRLLRQPCNMGGAAALARGFSEATGEYLSWLSADDAFVDTGNLSAQVCRLRAGADVTYARSFYRGHSLSDLAHDELVDAHWHRRLPWLDELLLRWSSARVIALLFRVPINGSTVVIRRSAWERFGNFDPVLGNIDQDSDMWLRYSALGARFAMTQKPAALYRLHPGQTSHQREECLLGSAATRIRVLMALNDVGSLRGMLSTTWPILAVAWRAGWYRSRPLVAAYLCACSRTARPSWPARYWLRRIEESLREEGLPDEVLYRSAVDKAREMFESSEFAKFRLKLEP